jgi:glycosyltransferase involved in cell wall biosynthesis
MRVLILNQAFYPDVVSTAQHASDLAAELAARGHDVEVIASSRAYDNPATRFPRRESWRGVSIRRVPCFGLGKGAKWRRAADFASYLLSCFFAMLATPRCDTIVALTSPPLISVLAAFFARLKGSRFVFWMMDLNPDEAIASGWLRDGSFAARCLRRLLHYSLVRADSIVALDRFMQARIAHKGVPERRIEVIPPWSHDRVVKYDGPGRDAFRAAHGLAGKFVVMYSGNHSPCHPLDTLLSAAEELAGQPQIAFCFVGGGSEFAKVRAFAHARGLGNVVCLPYQPLGLLSASLSAADLHAVVLGDPFVGIVHPCKIYNILGVQSPVLYIGPSPSHVTEILSALPPTQAVLKRHGDVSGVAASILMSFRTRRRRPGLEIAEAYSQGRQLPRLCRLVESGREEEALPAMEAGAA